MHLDICHVPFFFLSSLEDMPIDFLEKGKRRKREKERDINVEEKHLLVASHMYTPWLGTEPTKHVPWSRTKPATFQFIGQHSNQLSHSGHGGKSLFINIGSWVLWLAYKGQINVNMMILMVLCPLHYMGIIFFYIWSHFHIELRTMKSIRKPYVNTCSLVLQ